jgi:hypothetical protein
MASPLETLKQLVPFDLGEMKFPEGKIGELAAKAEGLAGKVEQWAGKAEHLAGEAGEFAEKVGQWLSEVQVPGEEPPTSSKAPKPSVRLASSKASAPKSVPIPPRLRMAPQERKPGK